MSSDISKQEAQRQLWERGILHWILDDTQKELYHNYLESSNLTVVWMCSRRLGKSFALCTVAIEQCLKAPNQIVKYVAPKQKQVRTIIKPLIRDILDSCPKHLRPKYFTQDNIYKFPNGSEIQLAGTDNGNAESLRGGSANLCIVDEAGFCDELDYVVNSVLLPTMTTTGGKIILASTPPLSSSHKFMSYFVARAKAEGNLVVKTIYDNPRMTAEQIQAIAEEHGGTDSVTFRREYMCEMIVDQERAVIPEFTKELQEEIVKPWPRPPYYDSYTAMDIGFKDLTFVLFAYYDFRNDKIIIEDELVMSGQQMTTDKLAEGVKEKEKAIWKNPLDPYDQGESKDVYLRVSDNNLIVLNDLNRLHDLVFLPTDKDDADAALNQLRMKLASKKIIIHPRCVNLISHLENAIWNKSRTKFERSGDYGHYDGCEAAKYLVRNIIYSKNPYPPGYDIPNGDDVFLSPYMKPENNFEKSVKDMFSRKSTYKLTNKK